MYCWKTELVQTRLQDCVVGPYMNLYNSWWQLLQEMRITKRVQVEERTKWWFIEVIGAVSLSQCDDLARTVKVCQLQKSPENEPGGKIFDDDSSSPR